MRLSASRGRWCDMTIRFATMGRVTTLSSIINKVVVPGTERAGPSRTRWMPPPLPPACANPPCSFFAIRYHWLISSIMVAAFDERRTADEAEWSEGRTTCLLLGCSIVAPFSISLLCLHLNINCASLIFTLTSFMCGTKSKRLMNWLFNSSEK